MNQNLNVLNEIHKGLVMGMESISVIRSKVGDNDFKQVLDDQYKQYGKILDRVNEEFPNHGGEKPADTSPAQKMMGWTSIQMNTLTDKSNSKISEMLIQGTNMGIVEGRKLLNHKDTDEKIHALVQEYVAMQEDAVEKLKTFL